MSNAKRPHKPYDPSVKRSISFPQSIWARLDRDSADQVRTVSGHLRKLVLTHPDFKVGAAVKSEASK